MKLLLFNVSMITVVTVNCRDLSHPEPLQPEPLPALNSLGPEFPIKSQNERKASSKFPFQSSEATELGPPISAEEIAAAIANPSLMKPPPKDNNVMENLGMFQGDIMLTPEQEAQMNMGVRSASPLTKWQNGIIHYTISSVFTQNERLRIARAMAEFHEKTCIKFVGRTIETDYIEIISDDGCYSSAIGRNGNKQTLSLEQNNAQGYGCIFMGIIIHEFMHAAGFFHEQSRSDRDDYVTIHWQNIIPTTNAFFQFIPQTTSNTFDFGLEYDYSSIMHYKPNAFSINRNDDRYPTITPKKAGVTIGQRVGFSLLDVCGLNLLYQCGVPCIQCTQNGQLLPILDDCSNYIVCEHIGGGTYITKTMPCTDGLYFNPDNNVCDWPRNVPSC